MAKTKGAGKGPGKGNGRPPELEAERAQNTADINEALARVLDAMETDPSIPATQEDLAERAECSRGAIAYREGVKDRLKAIKQGRKEGPRQAPVPDSPEDLKQRLKEEEEKVMAARRETKVQFDKRLDLERKHEKLGKLYALQTELVTELRTKLSALGENSGTVLPFRPPAPAS